MKRPARLFLALAFYGFFTAAYSQAINGTTGSYPFPQNQNNPFGFHASVYNNQDIINAYDKWYADCITSYGAGGYLRILRPNDSGLQIDSTVSEGIGYAMVIAVYMNDQNLFNNIWQYEQLHVDANGLMNWYIDASGATDGTGGATDADEDMAWALLMAAKQWPGQSVAGNTYQNLAVAQINRIYSTETMGQTIIAGDSFGDINPSYFDPAYYREFEKATGQTGWTTVAANCYTVLNNNLSQGYGNAANGLDSAWCTSAGVSINGVGSAYTNYQYDACRTPFRIAEDYVWFGTTTAQTYLGLTSAFFSAIGATAIVDGYQLNGTPNAQLPTLTLFQNPGTQSAAFVGPAGVGGMVSRTYQSYMDNTYADLAGSNLLVGGTYYNESWTVMSLLMLSDNFLDYNLYPITGPTPTGTPVVAAFTATATPTIPTYTAFSPIYVDSGSTTQYVSASTGITWLADQAYTTGSWGYTGTTTVGTTTNTITGTLDPNLYKTDRYAANEQYVFTVPAGVYNITLKFAETAFNSAAQRIFAVSVGNEIGISDLDIWSAAGGENIAKDYTIPVTTTGAPLTISLVADVNYASINALSVVEQAEPPTSTATQTATNSSTNTVTNTATNTVTNTATNTPTNTSITSTYTNTATSTASSTATNSPMNTVTNTATNTSTSTATNTATLTVTNTVTSTATNSPTGTPPPTNTATNTFTNTPSSTATNTSTNTATQTATHTPTQTATNTATHTASMTSTNTATQTATSTATNSPTVTSTQTATNTATHSATTTSTQTATNTATNTPTITATLTATHSPTNTATNSATHTATNTATVTSTSSKTSTPTVTSTNTATGTATSTFTSQPTFTWTSTPTITPTYTPTISSDIVINPPYPNPSSGSPVTFYIQVPDQSTVTLDVFTLAFRKIYGETTQLYSYSSPPNLYWNLKDMTGSRVADGLYYVRVHVAGTKSATKILKVLILR